MSFLTNELMGRPRFSRYLTPRYADRHDPPVELLVKLEDRAGSSEAAAA